ncbi:hypothetical protein AFUB_080550 [Aspergillus niger]|uniref:F-box domain-containing protein n=1 Tax=Aspergillus niger TaxID=5061 RepID=A0A100IU60_ASPNG|nr:hypothetical protein AFUB_080550 [Aspergillus niger]
MDLPVYSTSQPSLCALPVELIQAILCNLPDLESLKSAQLTHSALYFAFIGAESHILKQILAQKIPTALLPDAFFAFDASTVEGVWTQDEVHSIIYRNRTRQISSSFRLNPQSAFKIIRLYRWPFTRADWRWCTEGIWYYSNSACLMTDPSPVGTLLCHGLRYIGHLVTAEAPDQHIMLSRELFGKPFMSSLPDIFRAIWESQDVFHAYPSLTCEVEGQIIDWQDTGYVGSDPGPANAWRTMMAATIPNGGVSTQVGSHFTSDLREQGYVFWDQVRIAEWGFSSNSIDLPHYSADWQLRLQLAMDSALIWRPHLYYNAGVGSWWYPREIAPCNIVRLPPGE